MSSYEFFETLEAATYLSRLFARECKLTEERKHLVRAYLTMIWAAQHLRQKKGCKRVMNVLSEECSLITKFLWRSVVDRALRAPSGEGQLTEDKKNLMSTHRVMMWVVKRLERKKGCKMITDTLSKQSSLIGEFLRKKR